MRWALALLNAVLLIIVSMVLLVEVYQHHVKVPMTVDEEVNRLTQQVYQRDTENSELLVQLNRCHGIQH